MLTGSIHPTGIPMPFVSACETILPDFMFAIGAVLNMDRELMKIKL